MSIPTYLNTRDIAKRLRLTRPTVQKFIRDGQLKAVKIGRAYLVEEGDLYAFLSKHKT